MGGAGMFQKLIGAVVGLALAGMVTAANPAVYRIEATR